MITTQISKSGKDIEGNMKPLVARAVGAATLLAQVMKDTALADKSKVTFDTRKRSSLSDEYVRLLGGKFASKAQWQGYADQGKNQANPNLTLSDHGWNWRSAQLWHQIGRFDDATFNRTGGMWAGLRVRNYGATAAIVEFAGKSEGQTGTWKQSRGRTKDGQPRKSKWNGKVDNSLKAWTVFKQKGVLLVQPDDATVLALTSAYEYVAAAWLDGELGSTTPAAASINLSGLAAQFQEALSRK